MVNIKTSRLMTHFRKRFGPEILNEINEMIVAVMKKDSRKDDDKRNDPSESTGGTGGSGNADDGTDCKKSGKLILDATCAPADIQYPTDVGLLNAAREKLEEIIDIMHKPEQGTRRKARNYRQKAHESYIAFKPKPATIHKMRGKQLRYIRRDLKIIESLVNRNGLEILGKRQYRNLLVIQELYRQQLEMYGNRQYRIGDRIVSISQPKEALINSKNPQNKEF